ncbi:Uncharacterised protein [Cedecea lapagei]|uniref:Uncharacterized protein n=1 Tax=Cedecea lapagei TaxID=158823 RepID=A0A447V5P3_9ENTR|nr:hypothetical protein [Cedecea lapagei]VEC00240.1 Uncharacterised protein [Cedecea lapagei]
MKETVAVICDEGLFAGKPSISGVEDIISYMMTRDSYARKEDADCDGVSVKRYAVVCKITVEEID